jgi:hypothetical protein
VDEGAARKRGQIPPRHHRRYTAERLRALLAERALWRRYDDICYTITGGNEAEVWDAQDDLFTHDANRVTAARLRVWFAVVASWDRPALLPAASADEPAPLITQLVHDLVTAPHAPSSGGVALVAA